MSGSIHPGRATRSSRTRLLAIVTVVIAAAALMSVLVAGCAGGSGSPAALTKSTASANSATTAGSSTATGAGATSSASTTPRTAGSGPLAFAICMRADGVPNFPDPNSARGALFNTAGIDTSAPAFQAAQAKCQKLMGPGPLGPGSNTHPTAQKLAKLLRIARCMRQHGIPQFPDPQTSVPSNPTAGGAGVITDFDGVILVFPGTINLQAPAYKQALTACGAPPLGLPH